MPPKSGPPSAANPTSRRGSVVLPADEPVAVPLEPPKSDAAGDVDAPPAASILSSADSLHPNKFGRSHGSLNAVPAPPIHPSILNARSTIALLVENVERLTARCKAAGVALPPLNAVELPTEPYDRFPYASAPVPAGPLAPGQYPVSSLCTRCNTTLLFPRLKAPVAIPAAPDTDVMFSGALTPQRDAGFLSSFPRGSVAGSARGGPLDPSGLLPDAYRAPSEAGTMSPSPASPLASERFAGRSAPLRISQLQRPKMFDRESQTQQAHGESDLHPKEVEVLSRNLAKWREEILRHHMAPPAMVGGAKGYAERAGVLPATTGHFPVFSSPEGGTIPLIAERHTTAGGAAGGAVRDDCGAGYAGGGDPLGYGTAAEDVQRAALPPAPSPGGDGEFMTSDAALQFASIRRLAMGSGTLGGGLSQRCPIVPRGAPLRGAGPGASMEAIRRTRDAEKDVAVREKAILALVIRVAGIASAEVAAAVRTGAPLPSATPFVDFTADTTPADTYTTKRLELEQQISDMRQALATNAAELRAAQLARGMTPTPPTGWVGVGSRAVQPSGLPPQATAFPNGVPSGASGLGLSGRGVGGKVVTASRSFAGAGKGPSDDVALDRLRVDRRLHALLRDTAAQLDRIGGVMDRIHGTRAPKRDPTYWWGHDGSCRAVRVWFEARSFDVYDYVNATRDYSMNAPFDAPTFAREGAPLGSTLGRGVARLQDRDPAVSYAGKPLDHISDGPMPSYHPDMTVPDTPARPLSSVRGEPIDAPGDASVVEPGDSVSAAGTALQPAPEQPPSAVGAASAAPSGTRSRANSRVESKAPSAASAPKSGA